MEAHLGTELYLKRKVHVELEHGIYEVLPVYGLWFGPLYEDLKRIICHSITVQLKVLESAINKYVCAKPRVADTA
jgi:hypothetical protein